MIVYWKNNNNYGILCDMIVCNGAITIIIYAELSLRRSDIWKRAIWGVTKNPPRARAKSEGIGERTRRQSIRNACAAFRRAGGLPRAWSKKNVTSDNFMRYSTFVEPGPMHGPRGKPSMRVRRENFHIISPSLTRGPAGRDRVFGVSCLYVVATTVCRRTRRDDAWIAPADGARRWEFRTRP